MNIRAALFFLVILLTLFPRLAFAEGGALPVVIINQVRGSEICCEAGSTDMLVAVTNYTRSFPLPIHWALRFDALTDEQFIASISALPQTQPKGLLLEVTPQFASASGVIYKGDANGADWHSSRNAFLIGYTQVERKKLLDTLFTLFKKHFHEYPSFTVAWMIDAWSLDYIRSQYGVQVHELTKEQFETDTYTLYGGIFNLAYPPSKTHPLIPDATNPLDMLVLRQTISDIDRNYGSYHSIYTSQPNDYLKNPEKKDIHYFEQLITESKKQRPESQFALIGLENSNEWQMWGQEYLKQLTIIADMEKAQEIKTYVVKDWYEQYKQNQKSQVGKILTSGNFPTSGKLWYFGKTYRALLEAWGNQIVLTDLRMYTSQTDPYFTNPAPVNRAYWIVPYLLDSSQQFTITDDTNLYYKGNPVRTDAGVNRFGFILTHEQLPQMEVTADEVILKNTTGTEVHLWPEKLTVANSDILLSQPIQLTFSELLDLNTEQYFTFPRHPRFFIIPDKEKSVIAFGWENKGLEKIVMTTATMKDHTWELVPRVELSQAEIDSLAPIFQPDSKQLFFEPANSIIYWNNLEAIAGRNPVRLMIDARNVLNRPVPLTNVQVNVVGDAIRVAKPDNITELLAPFFIDFSASASAQTQVSLTIDGNILPDKPVITFYTDCQKNVWTCLQDTNQLKGYVQLMMKELFSSRLADLKGQPKVMLLSFIEKIPQDSLKAFLKNKIN